MFLVHTNHTYSPVLHSSSSLNNYYYYYYNHNNNNDNTDPCFYCFITNVTYSIPYATQQY